MTADTIDLHPNAQDTRWARHREARLYQIWAILDRQVGQTVVEVNDQVGLTREQATSDRLKELAARGLAENLSTVDRRHSWVQRGQMAKPPQPKSAALAFEPVANIRPWSSLTTMAMAINGGLTAVGFSIGDHPGTLLGWWLSDHNEDHSAFSRRLGIVGPNINQIVNGQRAIGFIVALRLEDGTGVPADIWAYLWTCHQRAVVEAALSPRWVPVDIEIVEGNALTVDREPGAHWSCDVGGEHITGVAPGPLDVPAVAQAAIEDRVGLRYWEYQLELSIDGVAVTRPTGSPMVASSVAPRIIDGARKRHAANTGGSPQ